MIPSYLTSSSQEQQRKGVDLDKGMGELVVGF